MKTLRIITGTNLKDKVRNTKVKENTIFPYVCVPFLNLQNNGLGEMESK